MEQIFYPADILLPDKNIDMNKWSVIACDQFTSEPEYWEEVESYVGQAPSTLHLTLPEVYLDSEKETDKLKTIRQSMETYMKKELLVTYPDAMIYVERTDSTGKIRAGIIGAVDLMQYDFHKGSRSPVRATEGTIVERIPPRLRVRQNAPVELPHIMILIDDRKKTIIEKLSDQTGSMELLYDFDLMKGGGHLKGWLLTEGLKRQVLEGFERLAEEAGAALESGQAGEPGADLESGQAGEPGADLESGLENETGSASGQAASPLLFAVGDGNHSLATAKEYYEQLRSEHPDEDLSTHPARFALAEIVNLHSPALEFEAIHRIVTNVNTDDLYAHMTKALGLVRETKKNDNNDENYADNNDEYNAEYNDEIQRMRIVLKGQEESVVITRPTSKLTVGSLQNFLDQYIAEHAGREDIRLDYIHGEDNLKALTWQDSSIGFILPDMAKEELFPSVKADGALPRKTFSMGHAEDKRYYTECRKIR